MTAPPVEIRDLTRRFGAHLALDAVDLDVAPGSVHGLVGANGAGKTTLIKHILGLLRAQEGSVRVFGSDPVSDPVGVLSRIGYLSEENDLPAWMRVDELIRYSRSFYASWDATYADQLAEEFRLDRRAHIKNLSRGQKARVGLLVALAHRPQLLLLDEPSSGLDPIVRRDILSAVLRTIAHEGRTVLFSSHLLDEVEEVADHITLIRGGRVVLSEAVQHLEATHVWVRVRFGTETAEPPAIDGVLSWVGELRDWQAVVRIEDDSLADDFARREAEILERRPATLEEIFFAHAAADRQSRRRSVARQEP